MLCDAAVSRQQQRVRRCGVSRRKKGVKVVASMGATVMEVRAEPTTPYEGQKTGTSGLRKKTKVFVQEKYLANWIQSLFDALPAEEVRGSTMTLGGDGRFFNKEAAQIILRLAAGNGVGKVLVGRDAFMATPAASAVIRRRGALGGFIMSASHNPGGPDEDWGIKFNYSSGQPAPESITDQIFGFTEKVAALKVCDIGPVNLNDVGSTDFVIEDAGSTRSFTVEVIDPVDEYLSLLREVFDFDLIKAFVSRKDFTMRFDCMHAITGAYAQRIFCDELGAPAASVMNGTPLEDFGGGHPDPNLVYAKELADIMFGDDAPDFGAASDGDGDRNMILGSKFAVTPSDSVAIIAANAKECIPYFAGGIKGLARSMPTAAALDRVADKMGCPFFEVPTGWKFFGNLMDAGQLSICGEESFGTGSDHIREKDGIWAVLAWLSILAKKNETTENGALVGVEDVAATHWATYGRHYYSRYDYEGVESDKANAMMNALRAMTSTPAADVGNLRGELLARPGTSFVVDKIDDFEYTDPIDGSVASKQGIRLYMDDGSRAIFRLSGTGSSGATIRVYIERFVSDTSKLNEDTQAMLAPILAAALQISDLEAITGREKPTVNTCMSVVHTNKELATWDLK